VWALIAVIAHWLPVQSRAMDCAELLAGGALWMAIGGWLLSRLGSALPRTILRRLRLA
jgi:hypothetical protein